MNSSSLYKMKNFKNWIILILGLLLVVFYFKYSNLKTKGLKVKVDTIYQYTNKVGEKYVARDIFVKTQSELKKENSELSEELKKLKDHPILITKTNTKIQVDTFFVKVESEQLLDSIHQWVWSNDTSKFFLVKGQTKVKDDFSEFSTSIDKLQMNADLTLDLIEKDRQLSIITKSSNPYLQITNTQGTVVDPKKSKVLKSMFPQKRFGLGPYVGYGYNFSGKKFGPEIGISIGWHLIEW